MKQSFSVLCIIKSFLYERSYYEKITFSGQIYEDGKFSNGPNSLNFYQIVLKRVFWGALVFLFFEIFRKIDSLGEMGGKLNFVAAILDFGAKWRPSWIFKLATYDFRYQYHM